jgi:ABC-type transporter Mla maintaining outer membrane lipid asymmetry permease subunit MlaE
MTATISHFGLSVLLAVIEFGRFTRFCGSAFWWLVMRVSRWCRWRLIAPQLVAVGVASIPVVAITGAAGGIGLAAAQALASSGARLMLSDVDPARGAGHAMPAVRREDRVRIVTMKSESE